MMNHLVQSVVRSVVVVNIYIFVAAAVLLLHKYSVHKLMPSSKVSAQSVAVGAEQH